MAPLRQLSKLRTFDWGLLSPARRHARTSLEAIKVPVKISSEVPVRVDCRPRIGAGTIFFRFVTRRRA